MLNGKNYIANCLNSLIAQNYSELEIIVVDNASVDGSDNIVASEFPEVQLIRNPYNLGFSGGCNIGLRAATGEILILLNQDTVGYKGWLDIVAKRMISTPEIGIVGCQLLYEDGTVQHAGGKLIQPFWDGIHLKENDGSAKFDYLTGAVFAIRRACFEEVGEFDETFYPAYGEDVDYCFRAKAKNWQLFYEPQAILTHFEREQLGVNLELLIMTNVQRIRLVFKHQNLAWLEDIFFPAEQHRLTIHKSWDWLFAMSRSYSTIAFAVNQIATWRANFYQDEIPYASQRMLDILLTLRQTAIKSAESLVSEVNH